MFHYRKNRKTYASFPKPKTCPFCDKSQLHHPITKKTKYAYIVPNRVFYDLWELREVEDHLLVIPHRHVRSLHELSKEEQLDIMKLISVYESNGYNIYARAVNSGQRSVGHQHTHLIKTKDKPARGSILLTKPYWLKTF